MLHFFLAAAFVALGIGVGVSLFAILFRHAVPKAPAFFHLLCIGPMVVSVVASVILAWMALADADVFLGFSLDAYRLTLTLGLAATFWALNLYSYYYYVRGRYR